MDYNFIPKLTKEQLDFVAEDFLNQYYPEALFGNYININRLIKNTNLKIEYRKLSLNNMIFGLICFDDTIIQCYDKNMLPIKEKAVKGTIYIDVEAITKDMGINAINFVIVHEMVHWHIHKKYYAYKGKVAKKTYDKVVIPIDDIKWMEYQAEEVALRILLPKETMKKEINNCMKYYELIRNFENYCITTISNITHFSKEIIKMRLLKMGWQKKGFFEQIDGRYIKNYISKRALRYGESFSISLTNLLNLAMMDQKFRKLLSTNNYVFADNRLCFKHSKYIRLENNLFYLTDYAINHIDECCVLFLYDINQELEYINSYVNEYSNVLCNTQVRKQKFKIWGFESVDDIRVNPEKFGEYYNKVSRIIETSPNNFRKRLRYLRECIGMTRERLEEKSYISAQTIKAIETNDNRGCTVETLIALCVGMNLPPEFSFDVLRRAGFYIENYDDKKSCVYCYILRNLYNSEIEYVNEILKVNGISPLIEVKEKIGT